MKFGTFSFITVTEILGTIAFAVSGAMVSIEKKMDIFGVIILGIVTAVGGGIFRDIMLGNTPPRIFDSMYILLIAFLTSIFVFLVAYFEREKYFKNHKSVDRVINFFDACGLGLFTVTGMKVAQEAGISECVLLVFFGLLTGTGGGMIRDLLVNEIPFVLKKHVYAVASLAGGFSYYFMSHYLLPDAFAVVFAINLVVILRMLATYFCWDLPKVDWD